MLNRLFGRRGKPAPPPPPPPTGPAWGAPATPFLTYFNLHFHGLDLPAAANILRETHLPLAPSDPALLLVADGPWTTVMVAPDLAARIGYNRLTGQIAQEHDLWAMGYRVFAGHGADVHYFHGAEHVAGLAFAEDEIEVEPASPAVFASLAPVHHLLPRPDDQHPLDFHVALLNGLGIRHATFTWAEALAAQARGEFEQSILLERS